jgi:penicillin amidase
MDMSWPKIRHLLASTVLTAMAPCVPWLGRRSMVQGNGAIALTGLLGAVDVDFDRWGVPHVRAESLHDTLFAQGYLSAQERMAQMEVFRRAAGGRLAEVMGKKSLITDIFMREVGIHRVSRAIVNRLPGDSLHCLESYTEGVNAYLEQRTGILPIGLLLLAKGRPKPWKVEDSLAVQLLLSWSSDASWTADLMRARLYLEMGRERAEFLLPSSGTTNVPVVNYDREAGASPTPRPPPDCAREFLQYDEMDPPWMSPFVFLQAQGSSNWVLSPEKTLSGKPMLCVDTHARHTIPTLFYLCHLKASRPHLNVIGASLPGVPGVAMGRNDSLAWGATSLCADVTDLYVESFEGPNSRRYAVNGALEDAEIYEEEIGVYPGRSLRHQVVVTRHGPIIAREGDRGLALKWVGHDPDNDSVGCMIRMGMARDWEGFIASLKGYCGPAANMVFADVEGNIGYCAAARIPLRKGHDGSVPVPGESNAYEWEGYVTEAEMPRVLNPRNGWIATSNNEVVTGGFRHTITTMWESSARQGRIADLLTSGSELDVMAMRGILSDVYNRRGQILADELIKAAERIELIDSRTRLALDILNDWDAQADEESVAQSLYFMTWRILTERLLRHRLGHGLYHQYINSFRAVNEVVERVLTQRIEEWLHPSAGDFDELLMQCLEEALVRLENRYGSRDLRRWKWGRINSLFIPHLLGFSKAMCRATGMGPTPCRGDAETVHSSIPESNATVQLLARSSCGGVGVLPVQPGFYSDRVYAGTVFKMILDLSGENRSLWSLDIGQSSHPWSRFYRNFYRLWRRREYAPMAFTSQEIRKDISATLKLEPGGQENISSASRREVGDKGS